MKRVFITLAAVSALTGCASAREVWLEPTGMCLRAPFPPLVTSLSSVDEDAKMRFLANIQISEQSNAFPMFEGAQYIALHWNRHSPRICPQKNGIQHCIDISALPPCSA